AGEIDEFQLGRDHIQQVGQERFGQGGRQDVMDMMPLRQVPGPETQMVGRVEAGGEEDDAADMVEMRMAEQDFGVDRLFRGGERSAQAPKAGATVEDQQ